MCGEKDVKVLCKNCCENLGVDFNKNCLQVGLKILSKMNNPPILGIDDMRFGGPGYNCEKCGNLVPISHPNEIS